MEITIHTDDKTALLFGATGLVGGFCLKLLLASKAYKKVIVFTRRSTKVEHEKLEEHIIDFEKIAEYQHLIQGEDLFCCLGTTIKKAGSEDAFFKVDFTYAHQIAKAARDNGVSQFLLISSVGADENSLFFYNKVKGQLEKAIQRLGFWALHIFQPSVLIGEREENRFGEEIAGKVAGFIDRFTGGMMSKYRPVEADVVAGAMVNAAQQLEKGAFIYPSHWLQKLSNETDANGQLKQ